MTPEDFGKLGIFLAILGILLLTFNHQHLAAWQVFAGATGLVSSGILIGRNIR